jgi:hypothetical protein
MVWNLVEEMVSYMRRDIYRHPWSVVCGWSSEHVTSNIEWTHTHMQFVRSMHYLFLVVFLFVCFCMYLLRECWVKVECTSYISLFFSIFSYTFFVLCINIYYICHSKTYMKIRTKTIYIWMNEIMNFASLWSDIILFSM